MGDREVLLSHLLLGVLCRSLRHRDDLLGELVLVILAIHVEVEVLPHECVLKETELGLEDGGVLHRTDVSPGDYHRVLQKTRYTAPERAEQVRGQLAHLCAHQFLVEGLPWEVESAVIQHVALLPELHHHLADGAVCVKCHC